MNSTAVKLDTVNYSDDHLVAEIYWLVKMAKGKVTDKLILNRKSATYTSNVSRSEEIRQGPSPTLSESSFAFQVQRCKKGTSLIVPIKHENLNAHTPGAHRCPVAEH